MSATLDPERITALLAARTSPEVRLRVLAECESTNSLLLEAPPLEPGVIEVLACERQTAGRGRRGRSWLSWGEHSLTFSVRWQFARGEASPMGLSLAVGVALARALESLGAQGVGLKWPNDVLLRGADGWRKLAGVLIELSSGSQGHAAVIGVGVNLSLPDDAPADVPAAALAQAFKRPPDRNVVLAALIAELGVMLPAFGRQGFAPLRAEWQAHHAYADCPVVVAGDLGVLREGRCLGVAEDGALLIEPAHGHAERILSGDVSLRPA